MVVESNLEREFKFDVDPEFRSPDLEKVAGGVRALPEQRLVTTYYDTSTLRLWALGITLRFREEGSPTPAAGTRESARRRGPAVGKWTLKLPALTTATAPTTDAASADRWELTWKAAGARVPDGATEVIRGIIRTETLGPVVVLAAARRRWLLQEGDLPPWAEVDDDLVEVISGKRQGLTFRQLELELLAAGSDPPSPRVEAVLERLRRAGAREGGGSKFALAAGLDERDSTRAAPAATLGATLAHILAADAQRWLEADFRLRVPGTDGDQGRPPPEVVGLAFDAVARWRAHLAAFGPALDRSWAQPMRADLRHLAGVLGRLRAEDAVVGRVEARRDARAPDETADLLALLNADRHLSALDLMETLSSDSYLAMLERMDRSQEALPAGAGADDPARRGLRSALRRSWRRSRRAIRRLGPVAPGRAAARALRVAHTAEACSPVLGRRAERLAVVAHAAAATLTDLDDTRSAIDELHQLASHPSMTPGVAFVAGRVTGRLEAESIDLGRRAERDAHRLARHRSADWLR
ncbi:MAG: CHAD domain-containing protein [Acidobacteriota bacterium]|nr:CHAD domain-containing protein [Acidobacteriota bacterium]